MTSLRPEVKRLNKLADDLLADVAATTTLDLRFQRLIAETAMLRLFYVLDNASEAIALKLLTNSTYCDTSVPVRLRPAFRSIARAAVAVHSARQPRVRYLKWTTLSDFNLNLATFFPATEHLVTVRAVIDPVMEDMRHIRNHIAHGTKSTGRKFGQVVRKIYPAHPKGVSPGKLLLSKKKAFIGAPGHGRQRIIEQYLLWSKVAMKTLTKS
jgi:hypothetical protein